MDGEIGKDEVDRVQNQSCKKRKRNQKKKKGKMCVIRTPTVVRIIGGPNWFDPIEF